MNGRSWVILLLTVTFTLFSTISTIAAGSEAASISGKYIFTEPKRNERSEITIQQSGSDTYAVAINTQARYPFYFYGTGKFSDEGVLIVANTSTHDKYKAKPTLTVNLYFKNHEDLEDYAEKEGDPRFSNLQPGQVALLIGQDIYDAISWRGADGIRLPDGKRMFEKGGIPFSNVYTKEGVTVAPIQPKEKPEPPDPLAGLPSIPDSLNGHYTYADEQYMNFRVVRIQKTEQDSYAVAIETRMRHHFAYFYGTGKLVGDGIMLVTNTIRYKKRTADFSLKIYFKNHPDLAQYANKHKAPDYKKLKPGQIAIPYFEDQQKTIESMTGELEEQRRIRLPNGKFMFDGGAGGGFEGIYTRDKPAGATQATRQEVPRSEEPTSLPMPSKRNAPSFDCAKASNAVERAICADPMLSEMDVQVAARYKEALNVAPNKEVLRTEQRRWLQQMHTQCANTPDFTCIQRHYRDRLYQLKQQDAKPSTQLPTEQKSNAVEERARLEREINKLKEESERLKRESNKLQEDLARIGTEL